MTKNEFYRKYTHVNTLEVIFTLEEVSFEH